MSKFISDDIDCREVAIGFLKLGRCAGERVIVDGYVCPHCPSTDPSKKCLSPKPQKTTSSLRDYINA